MELRNRNFDLKMLVYYMDKSPSYLRKVESGQATIDSRYFEEINESVLQRISNTEFKLHERPRDSALRKRNFNRDGPAEEPARPAPVSKGVPQDKVVRATDNTGIVSYHLKPNPEYRLVSQAPPRSEETRQQARPQVPIRTEQRPFVAGGMLEEKLSFKHYNIFEGNFQVETEEGVVKQFEDVDYESPRLTS